MTDLFDDIEIQPDPQPVEPDEEQRPETDTVSNLPQCEICGTPIEWSGRGRKPKKCSEHRTRTTARDATGAPRRTVKQEARLAQLAEDLTTEMAAFGAGMAFALPVTGVTITARAEGTARALVRLAEKNPKLLAGLEVAAKAVPVTYLGETGFKVGTAVLVDIGRINPDSTLAKMSGASSIWHEINGTSGARDETPAMEGYEGFGFPPVDVPPRFQKVA